MLQRDMRSPPHQAVPRYLSSASCSMRAQRSARNIARVICVHIRKQQPGTTVRILDLTAQQDICAAHRTASPPRHFPVLELLDAFCLASCALSLLICFTPLMQNHFRIYGICLLLCILLRLISAHSAYQRLLIPCHSSSQRPPPPTAMATSIMASSGSLVVRRCSHHAGTAQVPARAGSRFVPARRINSYGYALQSAAAAKDAAQSARMTYSHESPDKKRNTDTMINTMLTTHDDQHKSWFRSACAPGNCSAHFPHSAPGHAQCS